MTGEPPADDSGDADVTAGEGNDTAADVAPDPQTQSGEASAANTAPIPETGSTSPDHEIDPDTESDGLEARLERLRPPQPSQAELQEPVSPAETLRPAVAQESESRSGDTESGERAGARHDTLPSDAHAAGQPNERERGTEEAALDELQPVATELRPATERTASDSQRCAPAAEDAADRTHGSDDAENEADEEDTEEV